MKDVWEQYKGKIAIAAIVIAVGLGGSFAGVEITTQEDNLVCVGIASSAE